MEQFPETPLLRKLALAFAVAAVCMGFTAQADECDPAHIGSVITNSPICTGDHVDLSVVATGDIIGYSWEGPGTGEQFSFSPEFSFLFPITGDYTVIVYGECGNDTATVTVAAQGAGAGNGGILQVCDNGPLKSLAVVLGPHDPGGAWTYFGEPHSDVYDPAIDPPGPYVYTVADSVSCPGANQSASVAVQLTRVGPAQSASICEVDSAMELSQSLEPGFTENGLWHQYVMLSMEPHSAMYDPALDSSGVFFYVVAGCTTSVTVEEGVATAWFNDVDQDGLGDPLDQVLACTAPTGYVADSSDACGTLAGTVGSHCDDGNPATVNDEVTADCECLGILWTTVEPADSSASFVLWPDPYSGGPLHFSGEFNGPVEILLMDMRGRTVWKGNNLNVTGDGSVVSLPAGLAPGTYVIRVASASAVQRASLVVR